MLRFRASSHPHFLHSPGVLNISTNVDAISLETEIGGSSSLHEKEGSFAETGRDWIQLVAPTYDTSLLPLIRPHNKQSNNKDVRKAISISK